jgi:hypothetical protein
VILTPLSDGTVEITESAIATISADAAYTVGSPSSATVSIADADSPPPPLPTVTISASDASATEGGDTGTFTVSRTGDTSAALAVGYAVGGTATSGLDYTNLSGSVTIPAGAASASIIVTAMSDALTEGTETVVATLLADSDYTIGASSAATINIVDVLFVPTVTLSATDSSASEAGGNNGAFTVTRNGSTAAALTVNYAMSGSAANGTDYASLSGSVVIPAGSASAVITVMPTADGLTEGTETAIAMLAPDPAYQIGSPSSGTVNISDPPPPTVSATALDDTAVENTGDTGTIRFTRTGSTAFSLDVFYTISGSATNGSDYSSLSGRVTIPAGSSSANVTINPVADGLKEMPETVTLNLAGGSGYTVGSPSSASVQITDM